MGLKHREWQCTGYEILNKGLQLSMAEFDRHLDRKKKKDERNLQTLNQGFGGLLLGFFDRLKKTEKISATSHNNKK